MKLTPQIRVLVVIVGCVLLVGLVGVGLLYPQYNKFVKVADDQNKAEASLLSAQTLLATRKQIQQKQAQLRTDLVQQKQEVPDEAELSDLIRTLQDLAYENNHWMFKIVNSYPEQQEGVKYNSWVMDVVVEGSWLDTITYLRDLRDTNRQVRILNVQSEELLDVRGRAEIAPRVLKHWDPGAYPARTTISCEVYFIPPANLKVKEKTADTTKESTTDENPSPTQEGGAQ